MEHVAPAGRPLAAAYLGASNGDAPEFFELFRAAFDAVDVRDCRHVVAAAASDADRAFLARAQLVMLAGGDPARGWDAFARAGLVAHLRAHHGRGGVFAGVSAGAMQLGLAAGACPAPRGALGLVPYLVGAHDEPAWDALRAALDATPDARAALGIPAGGGVVAWSDGAFEAVRRPATTFVRDADSGIVAAREHRVTDGSASTARRE
jgi:hypothetical protein